MRNFNVAFRDTWVCCVPFFLSFLSLLLVSQTVDFLSRRQFRGSTDDISTCDICKFFSFGISGGKGAHKS